MAKFLRYQDKEFIRRSANLLKGTTIGKLKIETEQFPKEITVTRKKLYPVMKKAKEDGNVVKLIKDKLFINGDTEGHIHFVLCMKNLWFKQSQISFSKMSRLPKHHDFSNIYIL